MLATATEKIGLHKIIAKKFLSLFPQNPKGVISALGLASCVLGTALSNSTTAILLLPIALSITQDYFLKMRFLLAVAFGASISGITTPIGSPPNLIFLGFLEKLGFDGISFTTWIFMMAPLTCLFGASISGITTPIGSPPNLIFLGFLEKLGFDGISFTTWIFMMAPLTCLMLYTMIYILSFGTQAHSIGSPPNLIFLGFLEKLGFDGISFTTWIFMMAPLTCLMLYTMIYILSFGTQAHSVEFKAFENIQVRAEHKRLLFFIALLLVVLFLNSPIKPLYDGLGLNENVILLAFGLLMFVPKLGFLDWDDSKSIPYELIFLFGAGFCMPKLGFLDWDDSKSIPYELIFLFGAGFCIATAFSQSELGGVFESYFMQFANLPFFVFLLLACVCAIIATGFLSTTALIAILLPIIYTATQSFLVADEPTITMLAITICASFSFMVPISTPPNAIVFEKGGIKVWDMVRFGFLLSVVGIVAVSIFAFAYWRWFLE